MRLLTGIFFCVLLLAGCSDDDCRVPDEGMGGIDFTVTESDSPFTGALELYPCASGTFDYYGNYVQGMLTPFNPLYIITQGNISNALRPVYLPLGLYRMIYWGAANTPSFDYPEVNSPRLSIKADLSQQYFSLRPVSNDTTFQPVYDFVFAVKDVRVGSQEGIAVALQRVVAGLNVILKNTGDTKFDPSIDTIVVYVGGIAEKMNCTTAEVENLTKTVRFPLTIASDSLTAVNETVMLFPSSPQPPFEIRITLKNGEVKTYKTRLANAFAANTRQTITITADILYSIISSGSGFEVSEWKEESSSLNATFE